MRVSRDCSKNDTTNDDLTLDIERDVAGEGAYGCVHKPSIHCKKGIDPKFDYEEYVSKIMTTNHAKTELKEFVVIGSYDKTNEYHLGTPILCSPQLDAHVYRDIAKCKYISDSEKVLQIKKNIIHKIIHRINCTHSNSSIKSIHCNHTTITYDKIIM